MAITARRMTEIISLYNDPSIIDLGTHHTEREAIQASLMLIFGTHKLREIKIPRKCSMFVCRIRSHHAMTWGLDGWGRVYSQRSHV